MTALYPSHHREAPATRVPTVPSMNYCQPQRNQPDRRLAAFAVRALGVCEIRECTGPSGWSLGGGFLLWAGEPPGFRFGDQWLPLTRRRSITPRVRPASSNTHRGTEGSNPFPSSAEPVSHTDQAAAAHLSCDLREPKVLRAAIKVLRRRTSWHIWAERRSI